MEGFSDRRIVLFLYTLFMTCWLVSERQKEVMNVRFYGGVRGGVNRVIPIFNQRFENNFENSFLMSSRD